VGNDSVDQVDCIRFSLSLFLSFFLSFIHSIFTFFFSLNVCLTIILAAEVQFLFAREQQVTQSARNRWDSAH
jgi:hypothetical protein